MDEHQPGKTIAELLGQPPLGSEGRDRLVAAGIDLFYRHGYGAVGLDQILHHAGVTKSTFYKHFECKDDLVLECVIQRDRWEARAWASAVEEIAGDDPAAQLLAFFDVLSLWFNAPDFRGCLFINTAAEFADPRHPVHQAAAAHKRAARDQFRDLAARAGLADPDSFADQFTIIFEGTLILRHVHGRNDAADLAKPTAEALLNASRARTE